MLFRKAILEQIKAGKVDIAFRRWKRPTVRSGGRIRTAIGELAIDEVATVTEAEIKNSDAQRAGFRNRSELVSELNQRSDGRIYRIAIRFLGEDRRKLLAQDAELSVRELETIASKMLSLDRGKSGVPWPKETLALIARCPGQRAGDLAKACGMETAPFKWRVRRLKELGLTESLSVGYRLSPRGKRVLDHLTAGAGK